MNNEIRNIIRNSLPTPKNRGCAVMLSGVIHRLLGACFPEKSYYYTNIYCSCDGFILNGVYPQEGWGGGKLVHLPHYNNANAMFKDNRQSPFNKSKFIFIWLD